MTLGTVKRGWSDDDARGVLSSPDVPGEVLAQFSHIEAEGYRTLTDGEQVQFQWAHYPPGQDGYFYRATRVVRLPR
jgi:CspA family cold shock protein